MHITTLLLRIVGPDIKVYMSWLNVLVEVVDVAIVEEAFSEGGAIIYC